MRIKVIKYDGTEMFYDALSFEFRTNQVSNWIKIKFRENDVIVMTFDPELWTLENAIETFDAIEAKFPNHNFIGMVKGIEFSVENIDSMIAQLEEMKK